MRAGSKKRSALPGREGAFLRDGNKKGAHRCERLLLCTISDRTGNLARTQAACAGIHMARSPVDNRFHAFDIRFPSPVGPSVGVGDFDAKSNALAADIALSHLLHLLAL